MYHNIIIGFLFIDLTAFYETYGHFSALREHRFRREGTPYGLRREARHDIFTRVSSYTNK